MSNEALLHCLSLDANAPRPDAWAELHAASDDVIIEAARLRDAMQLRADLAAWRASIADFRTL